MTHDPRIQPGDATVDKLELHARQQLSALVDGELSPDEARFLLRRLQHDTELSGRYERWHLAGDILRGQVRRAAAPGFAERVATAVAGEPAAEGRPAAVAGAGRRRGLARWGGGAALAASVAAVAMMVTGREELPQPAPPLVAMQTLPSTEARLAAPPAQAASSAASREAAIAQAPRTAVAASRRTAVVADATPAAQPGPAAPALPLVADAGAGVLRPTDPFASSAPLQARPWPRAALSQPASSSFTASFGQQAAPRPFYPFEPGPQLAVPAAADEAGDLPAPPPEDDAR
ncbi:sigma-E factor negative regulatory protein [Pseudoxanthomonas sp. 10H]|uniref:sigma-E factor negative regulatory protein n=1 Tax=Pseudoxanthomonas sp. 10H TaxID=3242729 RepID=UPI0035580B70